MQTVTTCIIGAGQAGLAMSRELSLRGIDHVVLERGTVANAWRKDRWDSLRLLTPNWANALPAAPHAEHDVDAYMHVADLVASLERYAAAISAPMKEETEVLAVSKSEDGYSLTTTRGPLRCRSLVLATGACARAQIPEISRAVPQRIRQLTPAHYKRPSDLPDGGVLVVGASASGVQLASEIQASGRQVILAVGNHIRMPRTYRGHDIELWLHAIGLMDERYDEVEDLERLRRLPSPQLIGGAAEVDLNALRRQAVELTGRVAAIRDDEVLFSGGFANLCASADLKQNRLLDTIDAWAKDHRPGAECMPPSRPEPTRMPNALRLSVRLDTGEIQSIVWATGFRPDFSWLDVPVFDRRGRLRHDGGVVASPGLYVLGLPFMRRRKSHHICGVGADAADLAAHLTAYLARPVGLAA